MEADEFAQKLQQEHACTAATAAGGDQGLLQLLPAGGARH
jgi:hypothetical protein